MALKKARKFDYSMKENNINEEEGTKTTNANNDLTPDEGNIKEEATPKVESAYGQMKNNNSQLMENNIPRSIFTPDDSNKEEQAKKEHHDDEKEEDDFFKEQNFSNDEIDSINSLQDIFINIINRKAKIPKGEIKFLIKQLKLKRNVETAKGTANLLTILFHLHKEINGEIKEFELNQNYYISNYPKSRFGKLYETLTGKRVSNQINIRELYGISGTAEIAHYTADNGDVFENIDVESIKGLRKNA